MGRWCWCDIGADGSECDNRSNVSRSSFARAAFILIALTLAGCRHGEHKTCIARTDCNSALDCVVNTDTPLGEGTCEQRCDDPMASCPSGFTCAWVIQSGQYGALACQPLASMGPVADVRRCDAFLNSSPTGLARELHGSATSSLLLSNGPRERSLSTRMRQHI